MAQGLPHYKEVFSKNTTWERGITLLPEPGLQPTAGWTWRPPTLPARFNQIVNPVNPGEEPPVLTTTRGILGVWCMTIGDTATHIKEGIKTNEGASGICFEYSIFIYIATTISVLLKCHTFMLNFTLSGGFPLDPVSGQVHMVLRITVAPAQLCADTGLWCKVNTAGSLPVQRNCGPGMHMWKLHLVWVYKEWQESSCKWPLMWLL